MVSILAYPGEEATPAQLLTLADSYHRAAFALRDPGRSVSAPFRLLAMHALELYLNALLLSQGNTHGAIRGLKHDLSLRCMLAATALQLRQKTADHLNRLAENRHYLTVRYDPQDAARPIHLNRFESTLNEVSEKVRSALVKLPPPER